MESRQVCTGVNIVKSLKLRGGNIEDLVAGVARARILQVEDTDGFYRATIKVTRFSVEVTPTIETAIQRVTTLFEQYVKLAQTLNYETTIASVRADDPGKLTDTIAARSEERRVGKERRAR